MNVDSQVLNQPSLSSPSNTGLTAVLEITKGGVTLDLTAEDFARILNFLNEKYGLVVCNTETRRFLGEFYAYCDPGAEDFFVKFEIDPSGNERDDDDDFDDQDF